MRYFEDIEVGERIELPPVTVTAEEIVAFGRKYDPQTFHTDPEAAKRSPFGGLIASGWHTCALVMRATVQRMQAEGNAGLGSPGVESCRWLRPVRPGDTLTATGEIVEARASRSRPYGIVKRRLEVKNQAGEAVMTMVGVGLVARRPDGAA